MKYTREKKLSKAKQTILDMLWSMEPVEGRAIFDAVGQTYYDRRIRELRESGWDIVTIGTKYQLLSHEKLPGFEREYLSERDKQLVLERDHGICQICGTVEPNMQFDHKVPLDRLGMTVIENMQLLCSPCNVAKRGVCKRCNMTTCDGCPYAYPELFGGRYIVFLDKHITRKIRMDARHRGVPESFLIAELLSDYYGL